MAVSSGPAALDEYMRRAFPRSKKRRKNPPAGTRKQLGWVPKTITFRTTPINPDLDSYPTEDYTFAFRR